MDRDGLLARILDALDAEDGIEAAYREGAQIIAETTDGRVYEVAVEDAG